MGLSLRRSRVYRSRRFFLVPTVAVLLSLVSMGRATVLGQVVVDGVAAIVGGALITLSDVRAVRRLGLLQLPPAATDGDIIKLLIDRELMRGEVGRFGTPEPEPEVLQARLAEVERQVGGAEALEEVLSICAMTDERLRAWLADDLKIARHLDDRFAAAATLTDDEVLRFYREQGARFAVEGTVPPFEEVAEVVREQANAERREALISQWVATLRRSAATRLPRR